MFKKFILAFFLLSIATACKYKEHPEFIKAEKIELKNFKNGNATISADVYFTNPNDFGGKLVTENIDVFFNNILIGKVTTKKFNVPARDTFSIPVTATFDLMKTVQENSAVLGNNIFDLITKKEFSLTLKGPIIFSKGPFSYTYDFNQTNKISL